ncbi:MAG TPA: alkylmercury lyase family protein [Candidatus Methylomirabilis sp.]|nr:alkylmercury lyase family protein [Candidatus Methylomirabilis sp.]
MAIAVIVDTVAKRLTQAKLSEVEDRARRYILRHFADTARAPGLAELRRELQLPAEVDAASILTRLHENDLIVYDAATTRIAAAYPFSGEPTGHQVEIGNRPLHALCAIDALGIPFMLDAPGVIRSGCFWCHAPIGVHIEGGVVAAHWPASVVGWYPEKDSCGCTATSLCVLINFFCSEDHLGAWRKANPCEEGIALNLQEAVDAGRMIFGDLLRS